LHPTSEEAGMTGLENGREPSPSSPTGRGSTDAAAALRIEVHSSFETAREEWTRFQTTAGGYPFQHHAWLKAWYDAIGRAEGVAPFIVIAKDDESVVRAIYPLGIRKLGFLRLLIPLGGKACDYHAPLIDQAFFAQRAPQFRAALWASIKTRARADATLLERLVPGEHGDPYGASVLRPHAARAHALVLGSDWDRFYRKRRGTKSRRTLREKQNRLARIGPIRFALAETAADRQRLIAAGVELKGRQLQHAGYRNPYHREGVRTFYRSLAALSPTDSALRVFSLTVGDEIAAVAVCVVDCEKLYYLLPAYDNDRFGKFSPGQLLLCDLMQWSIDHGLKVFDFTIGDERYKSDWCDVTTPLAYAVDGVNVRGKIAAEALIAWLSFRRLVTGHPVLRPMALVALDWLWSARQRLGRGPGSRPTRPAEQA
jgi:CelD/BcsL family acetyltransferase involved in cellulose biosynthesis